MVTGIEVTALLIVLGVVFGAYWIVKAIKPFVWNAVIGLVVFFVAEMAFGLEVAISPLVLLIVAIGGLPGAFIVILLSVLEVAFVPAVIIAAF